eukprot:4759726-Pyramimonas_sp.AAC.1
MSEAIRFENDVLRLGHVHCKGPQEWQARGWFSQTKYFGNAELGIRDFFAEVLGDEGPPNLVVLNEKL